MEESTSSTPLKEKKNTSHKLDSVSFTIWMIGSILGKTWKINWSKVPDNLNPLKKDTQGKIYALWHSNILSLAYIFRKSNCSVLISSSNDGRRAAAVAAKWNYEIIYGSSSRQGFSAFRQCHKSLKSKKNIVITPDGPKGPREIVKTGVAHLSLLTGAPVIPLSIQPSHFWRLKSWDRMIIPKPFSSISVLVGDEFSSMNFGRSETDIEQARKMIEENLHAITLA